MLESVKSIIFSCVVFCCICFFGYFGYILYQNAKLKHTAQQASMDSKFQKTISKNIVIEAKIAQTQTNKISSKIQQTKDNVIDAKNKNNIKAQILCEFNNFSNIDYVC